MAGYIFGLDSLDSLRLYTSDYMDKMDLFGYSYVPGFKPTKSRFLVCEIKRDAAHLEDIDQLMKYVDWVRDEYCYGDYAMIRAFLVDRKSTRLNSSHT